MPKVVFNLNKLRFEIKDERDTDLNVRASYGQVRLWGVLHAPYDGHMNLFKNNSKIERLTGRLTAIFIYDKSGEVRYFMPDETTDFKAKKGRALALTGMHDCPINIAYPRSLRFDQLRPEQGERA